MKNNEKDYYTKEFYSLIQSESRQSAEVIIPLILDLMPCKKIVDVGCGNGTWLKTFHEYGVKEILGVDGNYLDEETLLIPKDNFLPFDLKNRLSIPQSFDLVISLEVAEHLPTEYSETFVDSLTSLGSVILFSAAIPNQGGENHINEQWQEFWAKLFQERGYLVFDYLRQKVWSNSKVAYYYRQNTMLFIEKNYFKKSSLETKLKSYEVKDISLLSVVHPIKYSTAIESSKTINLDNISLRHIINMLPQIVVKSLKERIRSI